MLLREHLGRLVSQKLQVLAQVTTGQGGVDDVVHKSAAGSNLGNTNNEFRSDKSRYGSPYSRGGEKKVHLNVANTLPV